MPYIIIVVLIAYALRRLSVARSLAGDQTVPLVPREYAMLVIFTLAPPLYVVGAGAPMYWMLVALLTGLLFSYAFHFEWTHPQPLTEDERAAYGLDEDETESDDLDLSALDTYDDDPYGLDDDPYETYEDENHTTGGHH